MLKGLLTATFLLATALALPSIGAAQYLYLDTNGDGVHSGADRLNASGATSLDIWLDTQHDRDGSLQTCNSHTPAPDSGSPLDFFGYTLVLQATGGAVSWGTFTPADPAYTADTADLADNHDTEFTRTRPAGTVTPPGLVKLGTISVSPVSGAPAVSVGTSTSIDPFGFGTAFQTDCEASDFPNSYVLGLDWFDTDGAAAALTGNIPPMISAPATASASAGSPATINATATDADAGDVLTISASGAPASFTFTHSPSSSPASASLSGTPTFAEAAGSPYSILWQVNDGAGGNGSTTTSLTVTRTDTPPSFSSPDTALFAETIDGEFGIGVSDAEGDPITSLTASGLPSGADFSTGATNNSGFVEWTPASGQAGSYPVTFTAVSGPGALSASKTVIFKVGPPDHRPIVTLTPTTYTINEGQHIHLTPTAADPDGDPLTSFTCKGTQNTQLPAGVTFTTSPDFHNGTFDWTPDFNQEAVYHFDLETTSVGSLGEQISAGLNNGGATVVLVINVRNTDRAPVVSAPASVSGAEGSPLTVNVSASDPDGNAISSLAVTTPLPAGALFAPGPGNTTGTLTWTPDFTQEGAYDVTFRATALLLSGTATTHITVAHANAAPVLSAPSSRSVDEGTPLSFTVSATDGDGDHVTLSAPSRPVGAGFTDHGDNTGTFDWTPGFGQAGTYTVAFAGNDGHGGVATAMTAITVSNVNRAPSSNPGGPYSGLTGVPVNFDGSASSDPDGDALSYGWSFGDGGNATGSKPSHTYATGGTYAVDLTVTDTGTPALSNTASTTADITSFLATRVYVVGGNSTIKLNSGKPTWCAQVEPVSGNFSISDVRLNTLVLKYGGSQITDGGSKTTVGQDKDQNGIAEIGACFSKPDLRTLFAGLPSGKTHVTLTIEADLTAGGKIQGTIEVDVQKGGGSTMEVAVSPNPLNPRALLSFVMERPGTARVVLYDLSGRLVKTLMPESYQSAGYHELTIDGRGDHGEKLPSGVYFYEVRTAESVGQGRVTILK